jgi:hypothetical protein
MRSTRRNHTCWNGGSRRALDLVARVYVPELERTPAGQPALQLDGHTGECPQHQRAAGSAMSSGLRHVGQPRSGASRPASSGCWNEAAMMKIGWPCWMASTRRDGETVAIARLRSHVIDDRRLDVAGTQKVGVQAVHHAGPPRCAGPQTAPDPAPVHRTRTRTDVAALAAEQVLLQAFELEQIDQFADHGLRHGEFGILGHGSAIIGAR